MLFSIVIPVYNVEEYLEKCIGSIINQNFHDYEVILVDDGSTDASGEKCDNWSNQYDFVKTIHKCNGGLDSARKAGLEYCTGVFVIFLDSDDWLADQCLKQLAKKLQDIDKDVDVIQTVYTVVYSNGDTRDINNFDAIFEGKRKISGSQFAINNFERKVSMNNVWSKIYRRQFLQEANLSVLPKYSCEDVETLCDCVMKGVCYSYINEKMVMFRSARPGSITTGLNYNYVMGYFETMVRLVEKFEHSDIVDKLRLESSCANMFMEECQYIESFTGEEKKKLYEYVKKNNYIMEYATEENWLFRIYKRRGVKAGNKLSLFMNRIYNMLHRRPAMKS